ncbi:hypothetical protein FGB62_50g04 [Gracilaria domingensis]|nr:hypothetical protein FGB62_50g04 [Gracilaria domingensis]
MSHIRVPPLLPTGAVAAAWPASAAPAEVVAALTCGYEPQLAAGPASQRAAAQRAVPATAAAAGDGARAAAGAAAQLAEAAPAPVVAALAGVHEANEAAGHEARRRCPPPHGKQGGVRWPPPAAAAHEYQPLRVVNARAAARAVQRAACHAAAPVARQPAHAVRRSRAQRGCSGGAPVAPARGGWACASKICEVWACEQPACADDGARVDVAGVATGRTETVLKVVRRAHKAQAQHAAPSARELAA